MCSYLLIGFWFTRPIAVNVCQTMILGLYWTTGSFDFQVLLKIFNNLIYNNGINFLFVSLYAWFLFVGAVAKSVKFPLHAPISTLIHAATMVW